MSGTERVEVIHVITGLPVGGAQTMLFNLIAYGDRQRFAHRVVALTEVGAMGGKIQELGVPVHGLRMNRKFPSPIDVARLFRHLNRHRCHIVQTWMYHADLLGGCAARIAGRRPILWNIRHSDLDPAGTKKHTLWTARTCARLSRRLPHAIICCSEASRRTHVAMGYDDAKMIVIGNGVDLTSFAPNGASSEALRKALRLPLDVPLIGLIGRYHPQKDHRTFFEAVRQLAETNTGVHFLLCGDGVVSSNQDLASLLASEMVRERCHLLGLRRDVADIIKALDFVVSSSSFGEGSGNVLLEAMACAVPCVVTDVGDSASIVGETGWVVPPREPKALAEAMREALSLSSECREALGLKARRRAEENYDIRLVVGRYESLYREMAAGRGT